MEYRLWKEICDVIVSFPPHANRVRYRFTDQQIVQVWFWSVIHDRPVSWACRRCNWPIHLRKKLLPSSSTMSRRLRSPQVKQLLKWIENQILRPSSKGTLYWMMDGKPLVISSASKDRQAGYGRAARGKAKGYKLHAIYGKNGAIASWRIAPMNKDERVMGRRLVRVAGVQGYLIADGGYDSNPLHEVCQECGELQLVTPPRGGMGLLHRRRKRSSGRTRSIELQESPFPQFGNQLLQDRKEIEREFGKLTNWGGGLTHLPPWARTHRRVHRWVQAKLIMNKIKRSSANATCAC
jgi:Transposase DDE domain